MNGFEYYSDSSSEDVAVYGRYGLYHDAPVQELAVFVVAGTNGSSTEDPRKVTLPHDSHQKKWLLSYAENVLGNSAEYLRGIHPLAISLAEGTELITKGEYHVRTKRLVNFHEEASRSALRIQGIHNLKNEQKKKIFERLGLTKEEIEVLLS